MKVHLSEYVRLVMVVKSIIVAAFPVTFHVHEPCLNVRAPAHEPLIVWTVTLFEFVAKSSVPVNAPNVIETTEGAYAAQHVMVPPPDEPSKVTVSAEPGTDWPPAPPEVAAQCVVSEASQVPVPPTQNRAAIRSVGYDLATHLHAVVATFQMKPTSRRVVPDVVVGSATVPEASNFAPHVIAREAVPVMEMMSFCPSVGLPVRFVVNEETSTACAVSR